MTSGQEGAYFDLASNSFWDSSRGFRGVPIPAPPRRSRRGSRHGSKKTLATSGWHPPPPPPPAHVCMACTKFHSQDGLN